MSEVENAPVEEPNTPAEEPRIPRERLNQEAAKRKQAEKELTELRTRLEELEASGLSELEQAKKRAEALERRAAEAEERATQQENAVKQTRAENWLSAAATAAGFEDAEDAVLRIKTDDIESPEDAERAVKKLAKAKPRLLKTDDPQLPGRVLADGRTPQPGKDPAREMGESFLREIEAVRTKSFPAAGMFDDR